MSSTSTTTETANKPPTTTTLVADSSSPATSTKEKKQEEAEKEEEEEEEVYDEIEIEDMTFSPSLQIYHYPCPCGDRFEIALASLRRGEDIAVCPGCSLTVRVIFEVEELPEETKEEGG